MLCFKQECVILNVVLQAKEVEMERRNKWLKMRKDWEKYCKGDKVS